MMGGLKVPQVLSSSRIESDDAIRIQISAIAVGAVEVISWRACRKISDAPLLIDRQFSPRVGTANIFPCFRRPRLIPWLAGMGHCVEDPSHFASNYVISAQIARWRLVFLA